MDYILPLSYLAALWDRERDLCISRNFLVGAYIIYLLRCPSATIYQPPGCSRLPECPAYHSLPAFESGISSKDQYINVTATFFLRGHVSRKRYSKHREILSCNLCQLSQGTLGYHVSCGSAYLINAFKGSLKPSLNHLHSAARSPRNTRVLHSSDALEEM